MEGLNRDEVEIIKQVVRSIEWCLKHDHRQDVEGLLADVIRAPHGHDPMWVIEPWMKDHEYW